MVKRVYRCFVFIFVFLTLSACGGKEPIRIGFTAELTGRNAALGVDGRDGALLAVETINDAGGIDGHPIELVVQDDLATAEGALAADKALIEADVSAIIGHMTSGTMMAVWPEVMDSEMVFLSPTVSTPELAGQKDNFFRLMPVNTDHARSLAHYAYDELAIRRVITFYDTSNLAYTQSYRDGFGTYFEELGGEVVADNQFSSLESPDFTHLLEEAKVAKVDGLLVLGSAVDTALLAQRAKLIDFDVQILISNWAFTDEVIQNGGEAVDGVLTVVSHDENNQSPAHLSFEGAFVKRFGRQPTFAAGYGYEAVQVLAFALEKTMGTQDDLGEALLETKNFTGVHGNISFDAYGDVQRTLYLLTIENGEMKTIKSVEIDLSK
ncbi:MAG: amino acid ABC transporter substrate-binding protein [Chloroflexi bacterium]|nr:amino acid ABC transporter substrate-binding protein [Chloroflexota bacterium]